MCLLSTNLRVQVVTIWRPWGRLGNRPTASCHACCRHCRNITMNFEQPGLAIWMQKVSSSLPYDWQVMNFQALQCSKSQQQNFTFKSEWQILHLSAWSIPMPINVHAKSKAEKLLIKHAFSISPACLATEHNLAHNTVASTYLNRQMETGISEWTID